MYSNGDMQYPKLIHCGISCSAAARKSQWWSFTLAIALLLGCLFLPAPNHEARSKRVVGSSVYTPYGVLSPRLYGCTAVRLYGYTEYYHLFASALLHVVHNIVLEQQEVGQHRDKWRDGEET